MHDNTTTVTIKIKLSFDGWHCLSKRQTGEILKKARSIFRNANFVDSVGLLIEDSDEFEIFRFCLDVVEHYRGSFGSWNGYEIKKISKKILYNYADRKRKLKFDYFSKLVRENDFKDVRIVLAGILYLDPDEIRDIIISIEKDFGHPCKDMDDDELADAYRVLLMYASSKDRSFSITNEGIDDN